MDKSDKKTKSLRNLQHEWRNIDSEEFKAVRCELERLKREKSYREVGTAIAMGKKEKDGTGIDRHAHSPEFVAHLLYVIDERHLPVILVQKAMGIQQGHLYRTLKRADIDFDATQSRDFMVYDDNLQSKPGDILIDPTERIIGINGVEYDFDDPDCPVRVWLDEEEVFRVAFNEGVTSVARRNFSMAWTPDEEEAEKRINKAIAGK